MPSLSSAFQKLKLRRSSNPPSPNSSLRSDQGRSSFDSRTRQSVDIPHGQQQQGVDHPVEGHEGGQFQDPVGAGGHVDGETDIARNVNGVLGGSSQPSTPTRSSHATTGGNQSHGTASPARTGPPTPQSHSRHASLSQGHQSSPLSANEPTEADRIRSQNITKNLPPVPAVGSTSPRQAQTEQAFDRDGFPVGQDVKRKNSIPRSKGTYTLPSVPKTGGLMDEVAAGLRDTSKSRSASHPTSQAVTTTQDRHTGSTPLQWRQASIAPLDNNHNLASPQTLFPYTAPNIEEQYRENRAFVRDQSILDPAKRKAAGITSFATNPTRAAPNPSYIASRQYSFTPFGSETAQQESEAHLQKHLALLQGKLFAPQQNARFIAPGKILPMQTTGPVVEPRERDRILRHQREQLVGRIAQNEKIAEREGQRAVKAQNGIEERTMEIFGRAGWNDRLGVLDTVDVRTKILEPVVQEHVVPFEIEVYELMIFREIHKYHIYPYIQPIHDPSPTILPTRHLFKDRDGNWREVIGDAAAERILGHKLDRNEGRYYEERWIEGISGVEYQVAERGSVEAGRKGWVKLVGDRLGNHHREQRVGVTAFSSTSTPATPSRSVRRDNVPEPVEIGVASQQPRKGSFSSTSPGRPVGPRSPRAPNDNVPLPAGASAQHVPASIGRAI